MQSKMLTKISQASDRSRNCGELVPDKYFDLVFSINALHNLHNRELDRALREMHRVGKHQYLCVESYRNETEKTNLLYWQVTCEQFNTPEDWEWWFKNTGFDGDYSFIYFE